MSNIYIYSRGDYLNLKEEFLNDKAIIRIHNVKDTNWYPLFEENKLVLFFEDIKTSQLSFVDKFKAKRNYKTKHFNKILALEVIDYIEKNKTKDFIIHCEYGRSRSAAIALFIRKHFSHEILNKNKQELLLHNDWVFNLLEKIY